MAKTVAETIKKITRKHLEKDGLLFGQAIKAVGWINNTVPDCKNIIELPMSDVSNMGIACGAAIAGRRPIIVIRFQDFMWLNGSVLVNYAAKSKDILGTPTPIFVRVLAKDNAGCVHSGKLHSMFMHFPGLRIWAPITPGEYRACWNDFMQNDDPVICFEHRATFENDKEFCSVYQKDADITIFAISFARLNALEAIDILKKDGIKCNMIHLIQLKPYKVCDTIVEILRKSKRGLVIDTGFETCGAGRDFAYQLTEASGIIVKAIGLEDKSVGIAKEHKNLTLSLEKIIKAVKELIDEKNSVD